MKRCYTCKKDKEVTEFNKNKCRADGLNSICKSCSQIRSKQYYQDNPGKHKKNVYRRKRLRIKYNHRFVLKYLYKKVCMDCGEPRVVCLDFDHVKGVKKHNISRLINESCSIATLKEELRKCEIVCANCHRLRTFTRKPSYKCALSFNGEAVNF